MQIFISHSGKDDPFTDRLSVALRQRGYLTWVDHEDVPAGTIWHKVVDQILSRADLMILVLSHASVASDAVMAEWYEFKEMGKPIIPITIENCRPPLLIRHLQRIDFADSARFMENLDRLLRFLPEPKIPANTQEVDQHRATFYQLSVMRLWAQQHNGKVQERLQHGQVMFVFPDLQRTLLLALDKDKFIVGWYDQETRVKPDIDLHQYGAVEKGVSRQHAMLDFGSSPCITDLSSRHGTRIEGIPLPSEKPMPLKNQMVLHLADLGMIVFLKQ